MVAHIGSVHGFGGHLFCYEQAVERLFASIDNNVDPIDVIAPPLLFLMRHSMELGYKFTLWELHEMNEDEYDPKGYNHHDLEKLHRKMREQHQKAVEKFGLPQSHVDNFEEYCAKTESCLRQFTLLDSGSFNFRYPIDTQGKPNFAPDRTIDLVELKRLYNDAMVLLRHTTDVLGEYVEIYRYWERDFRPW